MKLTMCMIVAIIPIALTRATLGNGITVDRETLRVTANGVGVWAPVQLPKDVKVSIEGGGDSVSIDFTATQGGELVWPIVLPAKQMKAFIIPMFEGSYVPTDDPQWAE